MFQDVELNRPGKTGFRKRVTKKDNVCPSVQRIQLYRC